MIEYTNFIGLYPLSKTLRFKLLPIGKTLENITRNGILTDDKHRAQSYQEVKKLIDEYHKEFIEHTLETFNLELLSTNKQNSLEEYHQLYLKEKNESELKNFTKTQENLRKQIAKTLQNEAKKASLFDKDMIKKNLPDFIQQHPDLKDKENLVKEFDEFTTYFTGFHENRRNMYSDEEKSTAIGYRIIHQNLPKFIDNMIVFSRIQSELQGELNLIAADFKDLLVVNNLDEMFTLPYFNQVLTQSQIDLYNMVIGGKSEEGKIKKQGLNEYINLYNQNHKEQKLPLFKPLFKQILSDRQSLSWLPQQFEEDQELLNAVRECFYSLNDSQCNLKHLQALLVSLADYNLNGIYLTNGPAITTISQQMFNDWNLINRAIIERMSRDIKASSKQKSEAKLEEEIRKRMDSTESFSIQYLNECIETSEIEDIKNAADKRIESAHFARLMICNKKTNEQENLFERIYTAYNEAQTLLNTPYPENQNLIQDQENVARIKYLLDTVKDLQLFVKPLLGKGYEIGKDDTFYGILTRLWTVIDQLTPLYDKVRNYLTRKPYSDKKIKLNFKNSTLLNGWDKNKEADNTAIIMRKEGLFYLGIMNKDIKGYKRMFEKCPQCSEEEAYYEKMEYKLLPGPNKMLPKVFFAKNNIELFKPSERIMAIRENETFKKGDKFNLADCHAFIDFYKESIAKHPEWKDFDFHFSETQLYNDISGFYREVEHQGYKMSFRKIPATYIDQLVENNELYLFQIYNKDFSEYSKGTPNMHTLYWKMLFDERNLADVVYKLNGQAELFYRPASLNYNRPTHPKNEPITNKNKNNPKKESIFKYDLTKDKRYTQDTFLLHVPITLNFKGTNNGNINQQVNSYLQTADNTHIIGIDRGERHLLYLVVIDMKGNIKEQFSLNEIANQNKGIEYRTNYHQLLENREKERVEARVNWQNIENIKDLKEGYLSQVIHLITQLMLKYHAIVVLEDLNFGFMKGRQKVEKSVYQKFEKQLIDKLNYLVNKQIDAEKPGGLLKAYQLAKPFESFQKMGKQSGFLFYIPAWMTSKIDPVTGFVNLLNTNYVNVKESQKFFSNFDRIAYNPEKDWLEWDIDYNKFTTKAKNSRHNWTICTQGERIENHRNEKNGQWNSQNVNLTEEFKKLFALYDIDLAQDLKKYIIQQNDAKFFKELHRILKLTLQMRNSQINSDIDYLVSPVANAEGCFYNSQTANATLPANADANGAYNIARKGLYLLQQIKKAPDLAKLKLTISNEEWLKFAQEKTYQND